jgi:antitoxin ChpS
MQTTKLRKVGGSIMMTVPPALLEELHLTAGSVVSIEGNDQIMTVRPCRPRYTAEQLLADYDATTPWTEEEREWLDAPAVGRELI